MIGPIVVQKAADALRWPDDFESHIVAGHVLPVLKAMPDDVIQTCITSPPYWGLRDYGTVGQIWDGQADCDHAWIDHIQPAANGIIHDGGMSGVGLNRQSATRKPKKSAFCDLCGAWRGEHGLEPTPELYVTHAVQIFRELRRVLRSDGTLWLNLGDSYANGGRTTDKPNSCSINDAEKFGDRITGGRLTVKDHPFLKDKDLIGIPWRVAFALQADGWFLRQAIIWNKDNGMPESVEDRCTTSHEYVFLLAKSGRYYFDSDAIREPYDQKTIERYKLPSMDVNPQGRQPGGQRSTKRKMIEPNPLGRRKRSVWTISAASYPDAHFATFPEKLVEPCILAGSRAGDFVFDPFSGSGTVCAVAKRLGRRWTGSELKLSFCKMSDRRLCQVELFGPEKGQNGGDLH